MKKKPRKMYKQYNVKYTLNKSKEINNPNWCYKILFVLESYYYPPIKSIFLR